MSERGAEQRMSDRREGALIIFNNNNGRTEVFVKIYSLRYARIKVRVFHSWARVRRNGPSAQFVRRSVGSLRRIGTWAPA